MADTDLRLRCDCSPVFNVQYDPESDASLADTVINALSAASGIDPKQHAPLYDAIDPDVLDQLFKHREVSETSPSNVVCFATEEWNVFVRNDGQVQVCDRDVPPKSSPIFDDPQD